MAIRDYAEENESEFYGQGFQAEGVVSVWVGASSLAGHPDATDVLQDLCGVGYYDIDDNEVFDEGSGLQPVEELLGQVSFSESFGGAAREAAAKKGVDMVRWVAVQFDFAYDPARVRRPTDERAVFLGTFAYDEQENVPGL